jgi:hypothetical protein
MTKATVEWSVQLLAAVILAEEMDEYSYLGESYARIYREDLMYIGFSYNDVSYLVLSRLSMLKRLGIAEE